MLPYTIFIYKTGKLIKTNQINKGCKLKEVKEVVKGDLLKVKRSRLE